MVKNKFDRYQELKVTQNGSCKMLFDLMDLQRKSHIYIDSKH